MFGLSSLGQAISQLPGGPVYKARERERKHQSEFAQHGIRWKVADATAAGLHPLAALGASTHSYKPQHIGAITSGWPDVGRIIKAAKGNRVSNDQNAMLELAKESAVLDNEYKRIRNKSAIMDMENQSPNQGNQLVDQVPSEVIRAAPGNAGISAGAKSGKDTYVDEYGGVQVEMNQELAEAMESAGIVKDVQRAIYDGARTIQMASSPKMRGKLRPVLINELRRTGRLKPGTTIYWHHGWQKFIVSKLRATKSRTRKFSGRQHFRQQSQKWDIMH